MTTVLAGVVTEQTREDGIRRSHGAKCHDIVIRSLGENRPSDFGAIRGAMFESHLALLDDATRSC